VAITGTVLPPRGGDLNLDADRANTLRRLDALARLFDSAWAVPGTRIRFGLDAVLDLIPGIGGLLANGVSLYLLWEAHRLGAPKALFARMIGNVAIDTVLGMVPVAGWVGDVFFRANLKNVALLRRHLEGAGP